MLDFLLFTLSSLEPYNLRSSITLNNSPCFTRISVWKRILHPYEKAISAGNPIVDIREDRIVLFGTVTQELKTFTYKVRAVNSGKYTVPPLFAEAMYDGTQRALRPQKSITISDK